MIPARLSVRTAVLRNQAIFPGKISKMPSLIQKFHSSSTRLNEAVRAIPDDALRQLLKDDLKTAMKAKDALASTVIRSIMSTLNNVDKEVAASQNSKKKIQSSVLDIIHKARSSRLEAAESFRLNGRDDLAQKEAQEADVLNKYLPRMLTSEEIEDNLRKVLATEGNTTNIGSLLKAFYQTVEKQQVDGSVVASTAKRLLQATS